MPDELRSPSGKVDFRNDGLIDSLTSTMAPELFRQNCARELNVALRTNQTFSLVSFSLISEGQSPALMEEEMITLASAITFSLRRDEFFSRNYENGFTIFLRGADSGFIPLNQRVVGHFQRLARVDLTPWRTHCVEWDQRESLTALFSRLDALYFG